MPDFPQFRNVSAMVPLCLGLGLFSPVSLTYWLCCASVLSSCVFTHASPHLIASLSSVVQLLCAVFLCLFSVVFKCLPTRLLMFFLIVFKNTFHGLYFCESLGMQYSIITCKQRVSQVSSNFMLQDWNFAPTEQWLSLSFLWPWQAPTLLWWFQLLYS